MMGDDKGAVGSPIQMLELTRKAKATMGRMILVNLMLLTVLLMKSTSLSR